ncbi:MAG TPA: c-type cytochrome [Casimicrobiaceae bacterium]|jgi:cytochrome c5|nr:c-type cytochrome [Casimicrobiaceae bacterium]
MTEEHSSFIKTPKQLAIVVALAFAIPIALIVLLSQLVTGVSPREGQSAADVQTRIAPVGQFTPAEANAPSGNQSGEQVYQAVCKTCHEAGLAGAPKFGDKAVWAPRIKSGADALFTSAIKGKNAMPPKGGNADLADVEVQRAVVYMANQAGAKFKEPSAPAQPAAAAAPPAQAPAAAAPAAASKALPPAATANAPLDMASGTAMMQKDGCAACHAIDKKIVGPAYQDVAAKYKGDKDAAAKLVQKVKAGGSGVWGSVPMPPNAQVPDADIKALVSWILTLKK